MKFSSIYWIAACLFFLANGFVLFGQGNACHKKRAPRDGVCREYRAEKCDVNGKYYDIVYEKIDVYISDGGMERKEKEPVIKKTGFMCGGRVIEPITGPFEDERVEDESMRTMQSFSLPCYNDYDCDWQQGGYLNGYTLHDYYEGSEYLYTGGSWNKNHENWICTRDPEMNSPPFWGFTIVAASWGDCYEDWIGEQ